MSAPPEERIAEPAGSMILAVSDVIEIVAGPFDRFQLLAGFVKALRALRGVREVTMRQFVRGMVTLRLRYSDPIALVTRLEGLTDFVAEIVSSSQKQIEVRVRPRDDVPPARS